ncbi:hypothetical protein BGZ98_007561 [Dissophora globulifera]|nr:hypothetical protein BGZ98_007561 [Dissophora globulifera]
MGDRIVPTSPSLFAVYEQQRQREPQQQFQDSPKKGAAFRGTLDTSITHLNKYTSASASKRQAQQGLATPPSSPATKPLVFKKTTKHQFLWSELEKMVASKDLAPMGRSEAVQKAYQKAIERRTRKYGSPDEYIRQRILHWPPAEDDDCSSVLSSDGNDSSTSWSSISPPASPTGPVDPLEVVLKKNEFPYSLKSGIEHWLIWSRHPLTDRDWIQKYLAERLPGRDFLFFTNPPELRSVPSIFHVQVFTKGEGEVLDEEDMENKRDRKEAAAAAAAAASDAAVSA